MPEQTAVQRDLKLRPFLCGAAQGLIQRIGVYLLVQRAGDTKTRGSRWDAVAKNTLATLSTLYQESDMNMVLSFVAVRERLPSGNSYFFTGYSPLK